ncbi:1949_t:CDS:1, partial [Cetraspora pellucida]
MSFEYLSDICENLFKNKKEIVLDIIQKNLNTQDIFYKERLDVVCNHLLKRFENEEKYNENSEDLEFLRYLSRSVNKKYNFAYLHFSEYTGDITETILIEMF